MNSWKTLLLLVAMPLAWFPAHAQHKTPSETQCRQMVDTMLESMKSAPLRNDKDKQDAKAVMDGAAKIAKDNRAQGVSECESWAAIVKLVATH